jgi:transcriptional regulator NrdR family protein
MKCPYCGGEDTHVYRVETYHEVVRRWRECLSCHRRFYAEEIKVHIPVRQKNGEYLSPIEQML